MCVGFLYSEVKRELSGCGKTLFKNLFSSLRKLTLCHTYIGMFLLYILAILRTLTVILNLLTEESLIIRHINNKLEMVVMHSTGVFKNEA